MLTIEIKQPTQQLYIPRNGRAVEGLPLLRFVSTADNTAPALDVPVEEAVEDGRYLRLVVSLPEGLHDGEWEYELTADGAVVSCGLATVTGSDRVNVIQYNDGKEQEYQEYGN